MAGFLNHTYADMEHYGLIIIETLVFIKFNESFYVVEVRHDHNCPNMIEKPIQSMVHVHEHKCNHITGPLQTKASMSQGQTIL